MCVCVYFVICALNVFILSHRTEQVFFCWCDVCLRKASIHWREYDAHRFYDGWNMIANCCFCCGNGVFVLWLWLWLTVFWTIFNFNVKSKVYSLYRTSYSRQHQLAPSRNIMVLDLNRNLNLKRPCLKFHYTAHITRYTQNLCFLRPSLSLSAWLWICVSLSV